MEDLQDIIREIQTYKKKLGLNASDDQILESATRIFNNPSFHRHDQTKPSLKPATPKQISFLVKRLNYKGDTSKLSKQEASHLIDERVK